MGNYIKKILKYYSEHGMDLPTAYDNRVKRGSISLLFAYTAHLVTIVGICLALVEHLKFGVLCAIGYSALMISFYMLRSLSKVKLDVDDGEIELDTNEKKQK